MHVLIVEDDPLFLETLEVFLKGKGCKTAVASHFKAAKESLLRSSFDFILLDNLLSDRDGTHLVSFIKSLSYRVPVIIVTADNDQIVMSEAFKKGADDFLIKPISVDLLWQKIQRCRGFYDKEIELEQQTKKLEKLLSKQKREEELARYVYEHVTALSTTETEFVDAYIQSSSSFNGDAFICDTAPNGNRFIILADATGHGLAAAICILPLLVTIRAMIRKGLSLAHIVHEANKKLTLELPDDKFVALIAVEINFNRQMLHLFNGGMPDVISLKTDKTLSLYSSASMALGILEPEDFDPAILTLDTGSIRNLFFFSDGLIEQPTPEGAPFGMRRLLEIFDRYNYEEPLVKLIFNKFSDFNGSTELVDDLSMCDLQVHSLMEAHLCEEKQAHSAKQGKITATLDITGELIANTDIIACLDSIMRSADMMGDMRQRAFTVFAELISNGVDHGILDLDSTLKNDFAGFAEYLQLKEQRLGNISQHEKLSMTFTYSPKTDEIDFEICDSGKGFDVNQKIVVSDDALSGRGLELIRKLSTKVDVIAPGNRTIVKLKRS